MKCVNCGTNVNDGEFFCPNCGTQIPQYTQTQQTNNFVLCSNCNAQNAVGSSHCYACGAKLNMGKRPKSDTTLIIILSVIAIICVIGVLFILFGGPFLFKAKTPMNNVDTVAYTDNVSHPQAPEQTYTPKPTPIPIEDPESPDRSHYVTYETYNDQKYAFSCPYPDVFYAISPLSSFTRLSLAANDGSGKIYICGTYNNGRTSSKVSDNFMSSHSYSEIIFNECRSDYCSVMISNGAKYNYCYYNLCDNKIRGFEMEFDADCYETYMDYAVNMQADIKLY